MEEESLIKTIPKTEVQIDKEVRMGGYGIIYKASYNGRRVAVKRLKLNKKDAKKEFLSEMDYLNMFDHPNIVKFFGRFSEPEMSYVMEYMDDGSLQDLLYKKTDYIYKYENVLDWALQCSSALAYLHSKEPKHLIHGDLKPGNLLLKNDFLTLKLADFGKLKQAVLTIKSGRSTPFYMAPEQFKDKPIYDASVDVYAFGITVWEVLTRTPPYSEYDSQLVASKVCSGVRPSASPKINGEMMDLLRECWKHDPVYRPQIKDVRQKIIEFMKPFNPQTPNLSSKMNPKAVPKSEFEDFLLISTPLTDTKQDTSSVEELPNDDVFKADLDYDLNLQMSLELKHDLIERLKGIAQMKDLINKRDLLKKLVDQAKERGAERDAVHEPDINGVR